MERKRGRPTVAEEERRSSRLNLRFTRAEHARILSQARIAGLKPVEFCRRRSLEYEVPAPLHQRVEPGLVRALNSVGLELKAIGNNANQLALASHTNRRFATSWQDVAARVHELSDELDVVLEKVVLVSELNQLGLDLSSIRSSATALARAAEAPDVVSGRPAEDESDDPKSAWKKVVDDITDHGKDITAALRRVVPPMEDET